MKELNRQIDGGGHGNKVEIISLCDNRQSTIGNKRNRLMEMANGQYTVFIDDDDRIGPDYIDLIIAGIEQDYPDVIGIIGVINTPNANGGSTDKMFYHTIRNHGYWESRRGYERVPNHLNPIKRSIGIKFKFPDTSFGEDTDWATQMMLARVLKTEHYIDKPIYFYDFKPNKDY